MLIPKLKNTHWRTGPHRKSMPSRVLFFLVLRLLVGTLGVGAHDSVYYNTSILSHRRVTRQIVPGTKWCGPGDRAAHDQDFGFFVETDKCCMAHDNCPMQLAGHEEKYGLKNPEPYTICHCDCDREFYSCLLKSATRTSRVVKEIYFTLLSRWCFQEKPSQPGRESNATEFEFVSEHAWRATWDRLKNIYWTVARLQSDIYVDRYKALEKPIDMPWFCQ